jgi:UDP-3-O-[3-hydroxymyristoyl] glucosamine N-acyltransferase
MSNPFFINNGPFKISEIFKILKTELKIEENLLVNDIKDLYNAEIDCITFFHSKKYNQIAKKTKASYCITTQNLKDYLPKNCTPIVVENVLVSTSLVTQKFYPNSIEDEYDASAVDIKDTTLKDIVTAGKNVLVGDNVKIGKNCLIGHNSIIERNVQIGDNCKIGSNTILKNSVIKDNVTILDNCVIGKKGFGFFPSQSKNLRYPHIGIVIINENSEIGCGSTIDRGSLSNTEIGENTIIAGQVGIAGSSIIGNNVKIGGQAGISGHLKVGNNVEIGGGSGVIKDIPDNAKVMGYPAKSIREFLKDNR